MLADVIGKFPHFIVNPTPPTSRPLFSHPSLTQALRVVVHCLSVFCTHANVSVRKYIFSIYVCTYLSVCVYMWHQKRCALHICELAKKKEIHINSQSMKNRFEHKKKTKRKEKQDRKCAYTYKIDCSTGCKSEHSTNTNTTQSSKTHNNNKNKQQRNTCTRIRARALTRTYSGVRINCAHEITKVQISIIDISQSSVALKYSKWFSFMFVFPFGTHTHTCTQTMKTHTHTHTVFSPALLVYFSSLARSYVVLRPLCCVLIEFVVCLVKNISKLISN